MSDLNAHVKIKNLNELEMYLKIAQSSASMLKMALKNIEDWQPDIGLTIYDAESGEKMGVRRLGNGKEGN